MSATKSLKKHGEEMTTAIGTSFDLSGLQFVLICRKERKEGKKGVRRSKEKKQRKGQEHRTWVAVPAST